MTDDPAIAVAGLSKAYADHRVLRDLSFTVRAGTVFALLGPNGSGKTTTISILSTLIRMDAGRATIAGHDVSADPGGVRAAIGVTGQISAVDNLLTGRENLRLIGDLLHLGRAGARRRAAELLERLELTAAADRPVSTYSGGMRRRLDLAMTLVTEPRVIFLDEPTTGLDPVSRRTIWQMVGELTAAGTTILLTTQYLEEADQLAGRVGVLDDGRLIAEGTPAELKRRVPGGHVVLGFAGADALLGAERAFGGGGAADRDALTLTLPSDGGPATLRAVLERLDEAGVAAERVSAGGATLDDVFLALTGARGEHAAEREAVAQ